MLVSMYMFIGNSGRLLKMDTDRQKGQNNNNIVTLSLLELLIAAQYCSSRIDLIYQKLYTIFENTPFVRPNIA
jgi:hypothetical protein